MTRPFKFTGPRFLKFVVFVVLACTVFGVAVMSLWNWLAPALFGWRTITFWQAVGLLILTRILFGGHGFRGGPPRGGHWRRHMFERWSQMSPEERDKFRQGMRFGCGPFEPPKSDSKPFESFG